jgi:hypothetical protein
MTRLPGSGDVPRVFALVMLVIAAAFAIAWIVNDLGALAPALLIAAAGLAVAVRSLFVGVLLAPDAVVVRGWLVTSRYGRGELRAVEAVPYWKFLDKKDPILSLLKFTPEKGWVREISTTVAWRDRTATHAARIREHLGIEQA